MNKKLLTALIASLVSACAVADPVALHTGGAQPTPAAPAPTPATASTAAPDSAQAWAAAPVVPSVNAGSAATSNDEWNSLVSAPPQAKLSFATKERAARAEVAARDAGKVGDLSPIAGDDGSILYPYGQSWPTVVCAPLHLCVIQLGRGDKPSQVVIGQPGMWQVTQAMAGDVPMLAVMPRFKGLHTNLLITATSASGEPREYYINLVSHEADYIAKVGFYFPGEIEQQWTMQAAQAKARADEQAQAKARVENETVAVLPSTAVSKLHFNWTSRCAGGPRMWFSDSCSDIEPNRVFDDGAHLYISVPPRLADTSGLPTLVSVNSAGQPAIINFRFKDNYYIVDGVPNQVNLIAGTGKDAKTVEIVRDGE